MDEHNGQLRVATNYRRGSSAVYVLEQSGDRLHLVGGLAGLAPNELLYSTRFVGDRAYLVTFQKVDPLHVIDLSDPSSPVELGQLVIPGFSDYLHPISENLIIGLGRHAENGFFQELQVSLFDVSDPFNPKRIHNYLIDGGRSTRFLGKDNPWGIGDLDHHSFSWFADQGVLALPLYSTQSGIRSGRDAPIYQGDASGVHLLTVNPQSGIELLGEIDFDEQVQRSIRIGDAVYALSNDTVKAVNLSDPNTVVANFSIQDDGTSQLVISPPRPNQVECELTMVDTHSPEEISVVTQSLIGDVTNDGMVNADDVEFVFSSFGETDSIADLDRDGFVNDRDIDLLFHEVLRTTRADLNLDGEIDHADLEIMIDGFDNDGASWSDGDINGDGSVDFFDGLELLKSAAL